MNIGAVVHAQGNVWSWADTPPADRLAMVEGQYAHMRECGINRFYTCPGTPLPDSGAVPSLDEITYVPSVVDPLLRDGSWVSRIWGRLMLHPKPEAYWHQDDWDSAHLPQAARHRAILKSYTKVPLVWSPPSRFMPDVERLLNPPYPDLMMWQFYVWQNGQSLEFDLNDLIHWCELVKGFEQRTKIRSGLFLQAFQDSPTSPAPIPTGTRKCLGICQGWGIEEIAFFTSLHWQGGVGKPDPYALYDGTKVYRHPYTGKGYWENAAGVIREVREFTEGRR